MIGSVLVGLLAVAFLPESAPVRLARRPLGRVPLAASE
jgi:hypothetical protein